MDASCLIGILFKKLKVSEKTSHFIKRELAEAHEHFPSHTFIKHIFQDFTYSSHNQLNALMHFSVTQLTNYLPSPRVKDFSKWVMSRDFSIRAWLLLEDLNFEFVDRSIAGDATPTTAASPATFTSITPIA